MKNYTENDIRTAAYFNWLNSGCQNGNDLQNWNLALQQLAGKASASKTNLKASASKIIASKSSNKNSTAKKKK